MSYMVDSHVRGVQSSEGCVDRQVQSVAPNRVASSSLVGITAWSAWDRDSCVSITVCRMSRDRCTRYRHGWIAVAIMPVDCDSDRS